MAAIRFEAFTGAFPRVDRRLLKPGAAQVAENVFLTSGRLDPMNQPTLVAATRSTDVVITTSDTDTVTDLATLIDWRVADIDSLIYHTAAEELWLVLDPTANAGNDIVRIDPADGTELGMIDLPAAAGSPLVDDPFDNQAWAWSSSGKVWKLDTSSYTGVEFSIAGIGNLWASPHDGTLWCYQSGAATALRQINKGTGALTSNYDTGAAIYDVEFDADDNAWTTTGSTKVLRKVAKASGTVTDYTLSTTYNLSFMAYDSGHDSLWIKTGGTTGEVIEFSLQSLTIVRTLSVTATGTASYARLCYDSARAVVWFTNDTLGKLYGINTSDGSTYREVDVTGPSGPVLGGTALYTVVTDAGETTVKKFTFGEEVVSSGGGEVLSIYRMYSGNTDYWLNWLSDVDVARSPIAGDTSFRIYYTSDSFEPRVSNLALATAGTPYPHSSYVLGVTPPVTKPNVSTSGGGAADVTRAYVYTFVTQWGEESAPSPASDEDTAPSDATWTVASMDTAPPNTYTISAAVWADGTLTLTVNTTFGLRAGEYVTITGLVPAALNRSWKVASVTNTTTFTIAMSDPGTISDQAGSAARDAPHNTTSMTKRIYRSITVGSLTAYYYIKEVSVATTSTTDDVSVIGEELPTSGWAMPPVDLQGVHTLPSGALVGFSGNTLCFSEPYVPYAWPTAYKLSTDYPIVGLGVFGYSVVVGTTGTPYVATGVDPETTTLTKLEKEWPCLAKRGIAEFNGGVYYPTNLGLALADASGVRLVSEPFFSQREWLALEPADFAAAHYEGAYYTKVVLANEEYVLGISSEHGVTRLTLQVDELYTDPGNGRLYAVYDDGIYEVAGQSGTPAVMGWTSGEVYLPQFTNLGAARVEADFATNAEAAANLAAYNAGIVSANAALMSANTTEGPLGTMLVNEYELNGSALGDPDDSARTLVFMLYTDNALLFSKELSVTETFRLPAGLKYNNFYIRLTGTAPVRTVVVGETPTGLRQV